MKETTSKLEQEVQTLRIFAQDTLEFLKEMREERGGAKLLQTTPAYYGALDTAGAAKITTQGSGASAALYGALGALPQQKTPSAALPTAFDRVVSNFNMGYIVGNLVHFKGVLEDVNNLHTVISHVQAFNTHLRVHGDSSQLFGKTISAKALRDLRLHDQNVAELTLSQWQDVCAFNFRQSRTDQDIFACLRKVQVEDVVTNSRISRDYYVKNYRAILGYLYTLEEFREQTEKYMGIACTLLEFEEAIPFLGESRSPVATIKAPPQKERHNRGYIAITLANRPHERKTNRPCECETSRHARDQDRKPRPREHSRERSRSQSSHHAPKPRGTAGDAQDDACFNCGKTGVRSGHPGCASPGEQNEKGKAALAAYKKRVDGLPRARSPHVMAAVASTRKTPRMSYARAASTTADPD